MNPEETDTDNSTASPSANVDPTTTKDSNKRPSQNKVAGVYAILEELDIFKDPTGRKHANIDGAAVPLRRSEQLKELVSQEYVRRHGETVTESNIEQAVLAISGKPLETRNVVVRVGGDAHRIVIDLVKDNMVAVVTAAGVTIEANPAAFIRPPGTASMRVADMTRFSLGDSAAAFDEYFALLGMDDEVNRAATGSYIVQAMRPQGPYAMLVVRGEQGGGKTTYARWIRGLIDPRSPADVELPRHNRHLAILAEHAHLISIDNISVISQTMSDAACRLATGSGFVTRMLGTDRSLAMFTGARPLMFTSIGDVAVAPDFLDRALLVTLPTRKAKMSEEQLAALFEELRPRLLAAVLHALHFGLKNIDSAQVPGEIRMIDAARLAVAAEPAMGLPTGSVVKAFLQTRTEAALITSLDSVVTRTLDLLQVKNHWDGSLEDLLVALHGSADTPRSRAVKDLPGNPRALRERLDRVGGALRHFGVTVDLSQLHPKHRTRIVVLTRSGAPKFNGHQNGHVGGDMALPT